MISIMMQSTNQKCHVLKSIFSVFLHSCNTPQKVIQSLAHMGLSVSVDSIHNVVESLSLKTYKMLHKMGQTLLIGYAYDNFNIDCKTNVSNTKKSRDTLTHLTFRALIYCTWNTGSNTKISNVQKSYGQNHSTIQISTPAQSCESTHSMTYTIFTQTQIIYLDSISASNLTHGNFYLTCTTTAQNIFGNSKCHLDSQSGLKKYL
jgi:hypothetical protein